MRTYRVKKYYGRLVASLIPLRFMVQRRRWFLFWETVAVFDTEREARQYIRRNG